MEQTGVLARAGGSPTAPEARVGKCTFSIGAVSGGRGTKMPAVLVFLSHSGFLWSDMSDGVPQEKQGRREEASFSRQIYGIRDAACVCQAKMGRVG